MKQIFTGFFFILFCLQNGFSQGIDYTGVWNGKFYDNTGFGLQEDEYRFEVQIAQSGKGLEGVTYSYLNTTFYGKATHDGYIKSDGKKIQIKETRLVEVKSMTGGACLMTCNMRYSKVGEDEFLEGTYTAVDMKDGSVCPGGYVKLRKVKKSIFGIDKKVQAKITENIKKKEQLVKSKPSLPKPKPPVVVQPKPKPKPDVVVQPKPKPKPVVVVQPKPKPINKDSIEKAIAIRKKAREDSLKNIALQVPKKDTLQKPVVVIPPVPEILKTRSSELVQTIEVIDTLEHILKFYDYGEVDGDIVTIFVNNKIVVSKALLNTKPIEIPLKLDMQNPEVTIVMVAENMGTIPPNTAFMVVNIAGKRYEAKIESTEQKNASIKFIYTGK